MERWKETLYMPLFVQQSPAVQRGLFAIEPRTEPPCDHPETQRQRRFGGGMDSCCVVCGAVVASEDIGRF
jgi:hypothetical protein